MIYIISKHHYYKDKGQDVERGLTRSWDKWYSYEVDLVDLVLIGKYDPLIRHTITIKRNKFNPNHYPIGEEIEYSPPKKTNPIINFFKILSVIFIIFTIVFSSYHVALFLGGDIRTAIFSCIVCGIVTVVSGLIVFVDSIVD